MKNILKISNLKQYIQSHKKTSFLILLILLGVGFGSSKFFGSSNAPEYITSIARKGNIDVVITGTGQITASNQVEVKSEVTGDLISINKKEGDEVKKGETIARLDATSALKDVQNAELKVENAKMAYDKAVKQALDQLGTSSISDTKKSYQNGYDAIATAFIDMPAVILGMNDIYYTSSHSPYFSDSNVSFYAGDTALKYKYDAGVQFDTSKKKYDPNFLSYKATTADSSPQEIVALLNQTYDTLRGLSAALTGTYNTVDYINARIVTAKPAEIASDKSNLSSYISKVNSDMTAISNALTAIENAKDSSATSDLNKRSAELTLSQEQDNLVDAQKALADHTIRAPFDGVVAKLSIKADDKISSGLTVATLITKQQVAEISMNEVDAAKIKIGQKARLTFDAIDDLSIDAIVSSVDTLGTVTQGVVNYGIQIAFDSPDNRIKSGMTVSASISIDSKENVIAVPTAAIKTQNGKSFVQVLDKATKLPTPIPVTLGISSDDETEIVSGLNEGEAYISRTIISSTAPKAATGANGGSLLQGGAAGGATRIRATGGGGAVFGR